MEIANAQKMGCVIGQYCEQVKMCNHDHIGEKHSKTLKNDVQFTYFLHAMQKHTLMHSTHVYTQLIVAYFYCNIACEPLYFN